MVEVFSAKLGFHHPNSMTLKCDIIQLFMRTKHIEIDCHFVQDEVLERLFNHCI